MNSLEQIPEEKENIDCLSKVPQSNPIPKQVLGLSNKALTINYSSVNTNKPLSHAGMKKVLSPQNQNGFSKLNTKSKSQNFSFKAIRAMPPVAVPEPATIEELEDQLQDYLKQLFLNDLQNQNREALILHQKTCQKDSKYVEAEMAKNRVQELKLLLEKRTKEDIKSRHTREKLIMFFVLKMNEIQKAYLDEMDQFNAFWDNKIAEYDGDSTKIEQECVQKQDQEMDNFINDLDKSLEIRPKDNAEILNLRKIEVELAKKEEYLFY